MKTRIRRSTPVGVPVFPSAAPARSPALAPRHLVGPISVISGDVSLELRSGSILIGRGSECDLVLQDTLVSRMHARIFVSPEGVRLEDLHSANGVYVNGDRIVQVAALSLGDHVFIGKQALTFAELGSEPAAAPSSRPSSMAAQLDGAAFEPMTPRFRGKSATIPITARAEALDLLGTLARRLANEQKAEQAPRMLGPHLRGILRGASSGLVVPESLSLLASEYALDIAHWTADARWLDYVIELHLATKRLMSAPILGALQRAERWVGPLNRSLLEYYVASFAQSAKELDAAEKARLTMLRRILKKK